MKKGGNAPLLPWLIGIGKAAGKGLPHGQEVALQNM